VEVVDDQAHFIKDHLPNHQGHDDIIPLDPDVQDTLDAQLKEYVEVYRGVLGFGYLVLGR